MPNGRRTGPLRVRQTVLALVLFACASSLESAPQGQANPLTVRFSPGAGTFVGSETITLSAQSGADIHYTLDGSLPTAAAPTYRAPLTVEKSTRLRAVAVGSGRQGPVATEIYLRVN